MTLLEQATNLYSRGLPDEALRIAKNGLAIEPQNEARLCDVAAASAYALGDHALAESFWRRAISLVTRSADTHFNLGTLLASTGREAEAEQYFLRATALNPRFADAYDCLGRCLANSKRAAEAEKCFRKALLLEPKLATAHFQLGRLLFESGRHAEAEKCYRRAIALETGMAEAFNNLGDLLSKSGRVNEADECLRRAIALDPGFADAHYNLANTLRDLGRLAEAEASYRRALQIKPDYAEAHSNLGNTLEDLGRPDEAEASYRRALEIKPDYAEAHNNLGVTLRFLGRLVESEASCRRALQINPDFAEAYSNLGVTVHDLGRLGEAEAGFRRAMEIKPDFADAHSNLIFTLDLVEGHGIVEQQAERRRWHERHGKRFAGAIRPHANLPDPERKLRIGYVSADFRQHSAYYAFSPIILHHDRDAFEVVCYSGVRNEDDLTRRLQQAAHEWRSTVGVSDEALVEQVRRDRIDLLVDLSGHSAGNRLLAFARKPAPVQLTAWGHATGTGLETMDYFLADPVMVPQVERDLYAEEVIDLSCFVCYEPPDYLPEVSPLPGLDARPFTFGCINRIEKISDRVIGLWGQILAALPEAQLLLKDRACDDEIVRQQLLRRLGAAGISAERVRMLGRSPHREHLRIFHEIDVGLDPFPQGGGISTAEALSMGVPVVSLLGATISSRIAPSILTAVGIPKWIAHSDDEYVRIAAQAARDLPGLARLRAELRSKVAASPLGDTPRYAREVETAYRGMWRRWCIENDQR